MIGFYDDYLKVTKQQAYTALLRQAAHHRARPSSRSSRVLRSRSLDGPGFATSLAFPFFKDLIVDLGWFFVVFAAFIIVGAGNAVNLTDGLDGLAIVPVIIAALSFGLISYLAGNALFADYLQIHYVAGTGELAVLCGAVIGAGSASSGTTRRRPRSSWAIPDRSRSAA